jgi:hypothetical protein
MRKSMSCTVSGLLLVLGVAAGNVHAAANDISLGTLDQTSFNGFIDELGTVIAYNPVSTAEPLGVLGFEIGVAVSTVSIDTAIWDKAVSDASAPSSLPIPRLMARKGLPMGFDIGLSRITIPDSNIAVTGFELRKAILEGSVATPAVTVLVHSSKLDGVDAFDVSSYGIDVGISKGFAMLTPYAGAGQVWIKGSDTSATLADRDSSITRSYAGVKVSFLPFMNLVAQADFAEVNSYSLRLNVGF